MPFNGSGVFVVSSTGQPVVAATLITAAVFNAFTADVATGLSTAILKDGTQTVTANIPMNNKRITGLGAPLVSTDAATLGNVQGTFTGAQPNPIINGNMEIWQRGTSFPSTASLQNTADRIRWIFSGTGVVNVARATNVPSVAQAGVLFNYSHEVDVTTASGALAAGDYYQVKYRMEGYDWRPFAQRDFVLSFWVLSTITGEHAVAFRNSGNDRSFVATYTINSSNTWEYKSVLVTASPTAGTWDYTNGTGLRIAFTLAAGSTFHTTAGAWQTGSFIATATTVNDMSSTANFFRLTGIKMELGSTASAIQFRSFGDEFALCQRYFQKSFPYDTTPAQNAGASGAAQIVSQVTASIGMAIVDHFIATMRDVPASLITFNPSAANGEVRNINDATDDTGASASANNRFISITFAANAVNTAGDVHRVHWTASAELS